MTKLIWTTWYVLWKLLTITVSVWNLSVSISALFINVPLSNSSNFIQCLKSERFLFGFQRFHYQVNSNRTFQFQMIPLNSNYYNAEIRMILFDFRRSVDQSCMFERSDFGHLYYECRNPNEIVVRTSPNVRNPNMHNRTQKSSDFRRSDFGIPLYIQKITTPL